MCVGQKKTRHRKWNSRALAKTFVGYCRCNAYRLLLDNGNIIVEARDVRIFESTEPGKTSTTVNAIIEFELRDENIIFDGNVHGAKPQTKESEVALIIPGTAYGRTESDSKTEVNHDELTYYPNPRRSEQRTEGFPPDWFNYDEMHMVTELKEQSKVLESYEMAVAYNDRAMWQMGMEEEMTALDKMETSDLVKLPSGRKYVKTKWVQDIKCNGEGAVFRLKARLVAKRFKQVERIDLQKVYWPVLRYVIIKLVLSLPKSRKHKKRILDVKNTFVNAPLKKTIYVIQPDGFA